MTYLEEVHQLLPDVPKAHSHQQHDDRILDEFDNVHVNDPLHSILDFAGVMFRGTENKEYGVG